MYGGPWRVLQHVTVVLLKTENFNRFTRKKNSYIELAWTCNKTPMDEKKLGHVTINEMNFNKPSYMKRKLKRKINV